jgi:hypothetical protein
VRSQVRRPIVALLLGFIMSLSLLSAPAYAGEDKGLCDENHARGTIPGNFVLDACFDGQTLFLKNGTQFPVVLTLSGNTVGQPERYNRGGATASSWLMNFVKPGDFGRNPAINAADFREGLIPPGYYVKAPTGDGEVKVHLDLAKSDVQKTYAIVEVLYRYLPANAGVDAVKTLGELIRELRDVGDQHLACLNRNGTWGDIGCSALLGRNVAFAFGRAAVGLSGDAVNAVVSLFDAASWANAAAGDLGNIQKSTRDFTIAAVPAPAAPPRAEPPAPPANPEPAPPANPEPPKQEQPKPEPQPENPGGGSNDGGSGNGGGGNPFPTFTIPSDPGGGDPDGSQPAPPKKPRAKTGTVQNKIVIGSDGLTEDDSPAYLSSSMQPYCASNGCKIGGTDMWSGDTFKAKCWDDGARMTNGNDSISGDDGNPHLHTSTRWMRGTRGGQTGYISFVYLTPKTRNLSVPHC